MYGLNIDPRNSGGNPDASELQKLGVKLARFQFDFASSVSVQAEIDFYKNKVVELHNAGIQSLIIVDYGSIGATRPMKSAPMNAWNGYISQLASFAGQLAGELKPYNAAYEIWNEPDDPHTTGDYQPGLREDVFGRMLTECYKAIKDATAWKATVVTGGMDSGIPEWFRNVLSSINWQKPFDAVGVHPYAKRPERNWPSPTADTGYAGDLLKGYHDVAGKPIWVTEYGLNTSDQSLQAQYLSRFYQDVKANQPYVQQVAWFCYSDAMGFADEAHFGLKTTSGAPKQAYYAYRDMPK